VTVSKEKMGEEERIRILPRMKHLAGGFESYLSKALA
jgi:hypothetical protein